MIPGGRGAVDCWLAGAALAAAALAVAGLLDWLFREIDPELWGPFLVLAVPLGACQALSAVGGPVFLGAGLLLWAAMLGLYLQGLLGGADVLAALLVAVAVPVPHEPGVGLLGLLPPLLVVTLAATLLGLAHKVAAVRRAVRLGGRLRGLSVEIPRRVLLSDRGLQWWVPEGVGVEEEWSWGLAGAPSRVLASPGTPMISHLAVAYAAYLLLTLAL